MCPVTDPSMLLDHVLPVKTGSLRFAVVIYNFKPIVLPYFINIPNWVGFCVIDKCNIAEYNPGSTTVRCLRLKLMIIIIIKIIFIVIEITAQGNRLGTPICDKP